MVERDQGGAQSSGVPTIAELLTAYRDRTGASYEEMARKVGDEINRSTMHKLATEPPKQFPKLARTVELLAQLLEVNVTTVVLAFAAGLGIPVSTSIPRLAQLLPPRADEVLSDRDRDAIIAMIRSLMEARNQSVHELVSADRHLSLAARHGESAGRRARAEQDRDAES